MEIMGKFALTINLFKENGKLIPEFNGADMHMPKEIVISQLKAFLKILEDSYNQDFKGNITTINGKPSNGSP